MKNPFTITDDKLRTLLGAYSSWCKRNQEERQYLTGHRKRARDLKKTLLNKQYLSKVSKDELMDEVFDYSRTLEGPAYIRLGEPRISAVIDRVKRNLLYFIDSSDEEIKKTLEIFSEKIMAETQSTKIHNDLQSDMTKSQWDIEDKSITIGLKKC